MGRQAYGNIAGLVAATTAVLLAATGCSVPDGVGAASGGPDAKGRTPASSSAPPSRGGGAPAPDADGRLPGLPGASLARTQLAGLKVAPQRSMTGYSRDRFPHWAEQGENCNTREAVLERDGSDVRRDGECRAVSGTWVSVYDGRTVTKASGLDIDHMVPLANAWRSGADGWTQEKRKAFANDLTHPQLLAVSAVTNRSKGDQGPDEWQPPARTYWCTYARAWTSVKSTYGLTVTPAEKAELVRMLDTCGN
ncbi:HNH endonuclease family protein [Streptomyces sp. NPDC058084]|uniref:HNH endonuclease family protein n=1 Tax=Streptomyces sp. NPDC058084 TaxID=3346333 RepID=UPI0036F0660F